MNNIVISQRQLCNLEIAKGDIIVEVTDNRTRMLSLSRRLPASTLFSIVANILAQTNTKYIHKTKRQNWNYCGKSEHNVDILETENPDTVTLTTSDESQFENYSIDLFLVTGTVQNLKAIFA